MVSGMVLWSRATRPRNAYSKAALSWEKNPLNSGNHEWTAEEFTAEKNQADPLCRVTGRE